MEKKKPTANKLDRICGHYTYKCGETDLMERCIQGQEKQIYVQC